MLAPTRARVLAALYAAALVYLSLLPFEFRPQSLAGAWDRFLAIRFLSLGLLDRADWIANLVAYVPLGFVLAAALDGRGRRAGAIVGATVIALVLAVAIEFLQVFFAPRTVSLNDLLAELIGAGAGAAAWPVLKDRLHEWAHELRVGGGRAARALLWAYAVAYVLISLFPYDFVTNAAELNAKLRSDAYGLLFAPGQCSAIVRCGLKLTAEVLAVVPLGWLLASYGGVLRARIGTGLAAGVVLGVILELAQFLLASGRSQGMSVLTRAAGVALGAVSKRALREVGVEDIVRSGRVLSIIAIAPYALLLAFVAGWFGAKPMGLDAALGRLPGFQYLPFHYHYFSSEARAVASAVTYAALYAPIGIAAWLRFRGRAAGAAIGAIAAAALALALELSKAFLPGKHPDVTDALIAGVSAWLVFKTLELVTSPERAAPGRIAAVAAESSRSAHAAGPAGAWILAVLLLAIVAWSVLAFPAFRMSLTVGLIAYAALLVWTPHAWLIVLPALLPVLDLAPWTGRLYWDEFDILLLVTLAVRVVVDARVPSGAVTRRPALPRVALGLLFASLLIGGARGLYPLQALDAGVFTSYFSPYNALRSLKAAAWGFALLALLSRDEAEGHSGIDRLSLGLAVGTGFSAAVIIVERWVFPGLLDFSSNFRVAGLFAPMHVGGAYIEAYLVAGIPFVMLQTLTSRSILLRLLWAAVAALAVYGLAVTYSRGGFVGLGIAALVILWAWLPRRGWTLAASTAAPGRRVGVALLGLGLAGLLAAPVMFGSFLGGRFATIEEDLNIRAAHWRQVLAIMDPGFATQLFGMGLGRFPETYFWRGRPDAPPASLGLGKVPGGTGYFLRLGGGPGLYFDQRVSLKRGEPYVLSLRVRSRPGGAPLAIALCEKSLIYSAACSHQSVPTGSEWHTVSLPMRLDALSTGRPAVARPAVLSLYNGRAGTVIDIDNVSLRDASGREALRNGDFSAAGDHWFFTSDDHLAWHVKNLPLHVFFEQGLVGLTALALIVLFGIRRLVAGARHDPAPAALLASIAGFLAVGLFDSLIDTPRFFLLFLILVFVSLYSHRVPLTGSGLAHGHSVSPGT